MVDLFTVKPQLIAIGLIILGTVFVTLSVDYQNLFLVLAGTTIIFWGGILFYIRPENMTPITILENICLDLYEELDSRFSEMKFIGKPVYYGGRSLDDIEVIKIKINQYEGGELHLSPPGYKIQKTIEKRMGVNVSKRNLKNIAMLLKKVVKEDLSLCRELEFDFIDDNTLSANIEGSIFSELYSKYNYPYLVGDPIVSALGCIITRSTGNPVVLENITMTSSGVKALYIIQKNDSADEVRLS